MAFASYADIYTFHFTYNRNDDIIHSKLSNTVLQAFSLNISKTVTQCGTGKG